jgi:hypothetical protein
MGMIQDVGRAGLFFLAVSGLGSNVSCSFEPTEPDRRQEWLTLDEYKGRASESAFLINPVVSVPKGAEVELRISKNPIGRVGDQLDSLFYDVLEPVDDQMVTVRLRARKMVHLDLEHLLASSDKKSWMPLAYHFFPFLRDSKVTVTTGGAKPDVVVPVLTSFDRLSMIRDSTFYVNLR